MNQSSTKSSDPPALNSLLNGYWMSQSVYAAAKLGLADLIGRGPQTAEQLAAATETNAAALYRLLRALASAGVFRENEKHQFEMTPVAERLRRDRDDSQWALAIMSGEEHYASWGQVLYTLRTGKNAFEKIYGEPIFDWLSTHPEQAAVFDQAMVGVHGRETGAMLAAYDFSEIRVLADVGGGNGSVLRAILAQYPTLRGMLCDLPGVLERAAPLNAAAKEVSERLQAIPTNFFEAVPSGADAYLMRHIIHDWNDEQSLTILRNIRRVIPPTGRLLLIEGVIQPGNDPDFTKLLDLNMMVIPGGKERTEAEYRELYAAAGFKLTQIVPTRVHVSVVEGRPV